MNRPCCKLDIFSIPPNAKKFSLGHYILLYYYDTIILFHIYYLMASDFINR